MTVSNPMVIRGLELLRTLEVPDHSTTDGMPYPYAWFFEHIYFGEWENEKYCQKEDEEEAVLESEPEFRSYYILGWLYALLKGNSACHQTKMLSDYFREQFLRDVGITRNWITFFGVTLCLNGMILENAGKLDGAQCTFIIDMTSRTDPFRIIEDNGFCTPFPYMPELLSKFDLELCRQGSEYVSDDWLAARRADSAGQLSIMKMSVIEWYRDENKG
ncbi:MAG: hypothetical protein KDC26_05420 [Armatimonadetes bacterium]|nr:hypothetical protein [Armatimonadota bacterium]